MARKQFDWEQEYVDGIQRLGEGKTELLALREKFPPYDGIRDPNGSMTDIPQLTEAVLLEIHEAQEKVRKAQNFVDRVKQILRGKDWHRGR